MQAAFARPVEIMLADKKRNRAGRKTRDARMTLTSGISGAPKHYRAVLVLLSTKDVVEANGKAVQVANVQRAKVVVKGIVQQAIVNGKVARRRTALW